MNFRRSFSILTYATCACAFITLACAAELHPVAIGIFAVAFLGAALRGRQSARPNGLLWLILSLIALGVAIFGWFVAGEHFNSVVYLFLYLELNKLWNARQNRDVMQIFGLTYFQMLGASVSTANPLFGVALVVYLFLIVASLITFTIKRDSELAFADRKSSARTGGERAIRMREIDSRRLDRLSRDRYFTPRLGGWLLLALMFILIAGTGVFMIIPRLQAQSISLGLSQSGSSHMTAGFSDSVNFTGIGEIQSDPTIALRVRPGVNFPMQDGVPGIDLLRLRGTSLDYFDGHSWMKSNLVQAKARSVHGREIEFSPDPVFKYSGAFYDVIIQTEISARGYVFGPDRAVTFKFDQEVKGSQDYVSDSFQTQSNNPDIPFTYRVQSRFPATDIVAKLAGRAIDAAATGPDLHKGLMHGDLEPEDFDTLYLQLPHSADMDGVRRVSDEWLGDLKAPQEIARRVERQLKNNFGYSLDTSFSSRPDHLTYFLTEQRAGHCEYFATAMALMLRMHGVHARVVNGYASDEWVAAGSYYIVRQEHAHSWVEAWIPELGWLTYDPTPAAGIGVNRVANTWYRRASHWYDTAKFVWYDKVIDYGAKDQVSMLWTLTRAMGDIPGPTQLFRLGFYYDRRDRQLHFQLGPGVAVGAVMLVAGLSAAAISLLRLVKRSRRIAREEREQEQGYISQERGAPEYLALLAEMEKIAPRPPSRTPLEHAHEVVQRRSPLLDFVPLTALYYNTRFNGGVWTRNETERANALLRLLREIAKDRAAH